MELWTSQIADMNLGAWVGLSASLGVLAVVLFLALSHYQLRSRPTIRPREVRRAEVRAPEPHFPFWLDIARCELHGDGTITTPEYWQCDCEIWPKGNHVCPRCGTRSDECPDATIEALVRKYGDTL